MTRWVLLLLGLPAALLVFVPEIDVAVARALLVAPDTFLWEHNTLSHAIKRDVETATTVWGVGLLLYLVAWLLFRGRRRFLVVPPRAVLYLLASLVVGPGLVTNTVFKDNWGRARPTQVELFGGDKAFTGALAPSDQCERNCSFFSGHAAMGFYVASLAFVDRRRRRLWMGAGLAAGLGLGALRMLQGGHFLSDVLFAGLMTIAVAWLLHRLMFRPRRAVLEATHPLSVETESDPPP